MAFHPETVRKRKMLVAKALAEYPLPTNTERELIERKMEEEFDVDIEEQHRLEALLAQHERDELWRMRKMALDGWAAGNEPFESILTPETVGKAN